MKKNMLKALVITGCITLITILIFLLLPFAADRYLLPGLLKELPFDKTTASISRLSPFHLRGSLEIEHQQKSVLSLPKFDVYFSPARLFQKDLGVLVVSNGDLHLYMKDGVPRFLMNSSPAKKQTTNEIGTLLSRLPAIINTIRFKQCNLIIHDTKQVQLSFNSSVDFDYIITDDKQLALSKILLNLNTDGDIPLTAQANLFREETHYRLRIQKLNLQKISAIAPLLPSFTPERLHGVLAIRAETALDKQTLTPTRFDGSATFQDFIFHQGGMVFQGNKNKQTTLQFSGTPRQIDYSLTGLQAQAKWQSDIQISGTAGTYPDINSHGTFSILARDKQNTLPLAGEFEITSVENNTASLKANIANKTPFQLQRGDQQLEIEDVKFTITAEKTADTLHSNAQFKANNITIPQLDVSVPGIQCTANISLEGKKASGQLQAAIPSIHSSPLQLQVDETSITLPFSLNLASKNPFPTGTGSVSIGAVRYGGEQLAAFSSDLFYEDYSAKADGTIISPLQDDLKVQINGVTDFWETSSFIMKMEETRILSDDLAPYLPIPDTVSFEGVLSFMVQLGTEPGTGAAFISLNDGNVNFPDSETTISGINTTLNIPNLPNPQSSPSQLLTVDTIELGALKFSKGDIYYRIEDMGSLFIEKSRLHWCGGLVESGSLRLSTTNNKIDTTLYCDRLGFAQLLDQFGIDNTEGKGSLNGKLPIQLSDKGINFDNGFLFSTPGETGIMHFNNTDMIRSGMPNLDQTATLSYSLQALEDFSYDWSRLTFSSKEDVLTLSMELKGKPATPLPFGYSNGQIVNAPDGPGMQHPVRLDLNFNLPQEDIFRFGKNLQSFKENL